MTSHLFDDEQPFCANPQCRLHVRPGEPGVSGFGNWAQIDEVLVGRGRYDGRMLCDLCGRTALAAASVDASPARVLM